MKLRSQSEAKEDNGHQLCRLREENEEKEADMAFKVEKEPKLRWQASRARTWSVDNQGVDNLGMTGDFPDVSITRHLEEELVLFPTYCKRHLKEQPRQKGSYVSCWSEQSQDAEDWKKEWETFDGDKAIVDVDVRGWLYSPQKGPISRKNRLLIRLARELCGIPSSKSSTETRKSSPGTTESPLGSRNSSSETESLRSRQQDHQDQRDQERIAEDAAMILKRGEDEAVIAELGRVSERPGEYALDLESNNGEPERRGRTSASRSLEDSDSPKSDRRPNSSASNQRSDMSQDELAAAKSQLIHRLMGFMVNPITSTPVIVLFYNDETSHLKTVLTNEVGHFFIREALDFVPTHIRVLASEHLSTSAQVKITKPKGISLISDVDDTIKHSGLGAGVREIFKNTFIRDSADLTIDGVKEWYNTMHDRGVDFHYVSNSPWQLFPVLDSFHQTTGLPPGSYHLKQYSGLLQGISEPAAGKKKATLEGIFRDFPGRRFLLIGDSGEADLEVYTDAALANPGRVIGIFIRDVTTLVERASSDSIHKVVPILKRSRSMSRLRSLSRHSSRMRRHTEPETLERPPPVPFIPSTKLKLQTSASATTSNLMDLVFDFEHKPEEMNVHKIHKPRLSRSFSHPGHLDIKPNDSDSTLVKSQLRAPQWKPVKSASLCSDTTDNSLRSTSPSPTSTSPAWSSHLPYQTASSDHLPSQTQNTSELSFLNFDPIQGYLPSTKDSVPVSYNILPSGSSDMSSKHHLPPSRGRRGEVSSVRNFGPVDEGIAPDAQVNKKLVLWRKRWLRAGELLAKQGVELRTWRTGDDVAAEVVQLVERNMIELGVESNVDEENGRGRQA